MEIKRSSIKWLTLVLLTNLILIAINPVNGAEYGEDSDSLGQFVDDFESLDNVSVAVNVVRNSTYNAMELNESTPEIVAYANFSVREHNFYSNVLWNPVMTFSIGAGANDYLQVSSTAGSMGRAHYFLVVNSTWLNGKYVRWSWSAGLSGGSAKILQFWVRGAEWDRTNDAHFAFGGLYGWTLEFYDRLVTAPTLGWTTEDYQCNNVTGVSNNVTIAWTLTDGWNGVSDWMRVDWIEINTGAGGVGNLLTIDFSDSMNLVMEQTGTLKDYGYVNNTGLPYTVGGYEADSYFTTTDYLAYVNGSTLVLMTNTTIPANTGITVELSTDNSTWTLNDWDPLVGGYESIDLRDDFYFSNFTYLRYNLTSSDTSATPRVYQSRLITTEGEGGATVTVDGVNWLPIALILGLAMVLLASKVKG